MKLFCIHTRHYSSYISFNLNPAKTPSTATPSVSDLLSLCKSGDLFDALKLLNSIDSRTILVKPLVYASILQTCTKVQSLKHGLQLHCHVIKSGLETDRFVGNSLLALYFKLGSNFDETRRVFDGLYVKDVVTWTSMISGYIKVGKARNSLDLYWRMVGEDVEPNGFTLSSVIKACSELGELNLGRGFHGVVFRRGFDGNNVIVSALIDMYGKNKQASYAIRLFGEMVEPDCICCTSVISACTRSDLYEKALGFFYMTQRNYPFVPDEYTFGSVLMACGNLGRIKQGKEVHAKVIVVGETNNVVVGSSLVDMYGKCGSVTNSRLVFDRMTRNNAVTLSALLNAYCQNGDFEIVIELFREMEVDLYSFGTVLRSCAGLAAVRQAKEVHCQYLRRGALLGACATSRNSTAAERIAKKMMELEPNNHLSYVLLANVYRDSGRWSDADKIRKLMQDRGVKKIMPGKSWIDIQGSLSLSSDKAYVKFPG
uniref:Pentacotripeptide-repeat region of PRORP domain-containing protein n=1 Tax=Daucus carota subsp. sativus TaxID=79200 RepID=A0A165XIQ0_DAUCS